MPNNANRGSILDPELSNYINRRQVVTASDTTYNAGISMNVNRRNLQSYLGTTANSRQVGADNYMNYLGGMNTYDSSQVDDGVNALMTDTLSGLEGAPYQFHQFVDRRLNQSDTTDPRTAETYIGRKYAEKILGRMPIMFITPCTAAFMQGFSDSDKSIAAQGLLDPGDDEREAMNLIQGQGKFYTPKFAYDKYYNYLNLMLNVVAIYLGLGNVRIKLGNNGNKRELGTMTWQDEGSSYFNERFFSSKEMLSFYLDNFTEVSHSVSNSFGDSSLAATINGFSDTANEIKFLFGTEGNAIANAIGGSKEMLSSVTSTLGGVLGNLGGGIVQSLAETGLNSVLNGSKIIFPQVWQDSSNDESYSFNFKFRSPDHDTLSIYLNVIKPYCKLLALAMAHMDEDNPNGYSSPFLVKASCKGMFNIDLGGISSLSISKGAECQWNDDGLPTQIDVSMDIQNLYSHLAITPYSYGDLTNKIIANNTAYMDFLANMAGLNIGKMEVGRRLRMRYYLMESQWDQAPARAGTMLDNAISNFIGRIYNVL